MYSSKLLYMYTIVITLVFLQTVVIQHCHRKWAIRTQVAQRSKALHLSARGVTIDALFRIQAVSLHRP